MQDCKCPVLCIIKRTDDMSIYREENAKESWDAGMKLAELR